MSAGWIWDLDLGEDGDQGWGAALHRQEEEEKARLGQRLAPGCFSEKTRLDWRGWGWQDRNVPALSLLGRRGGGGSKAWATPAQTYTPFLRYFMFSVPVAPTRRGTGTPAQLTLPGSHTCFDCIDFHSHTGTSFRDRCVVGGGEGGRSVLPTCQLH